MRDGGGRRADAQTIARWNHRGRWARTGGPLVGCLILWGAGGCTANDPVYFPAPAALQADGMNTPVKETLALRFRAPTDAEQKQTDQLSAQLGYSVPSLREDQIHLEVRYTVTNLGDREGKFALFLDGATEFTRFDYDTVAAAFVVAKQDPPVLGLIQPPNLPILAPGQVYQGVVREDDFHEASVDLDAMGRFMAPFVSVLINRSEVNPIGLEMVPSNLVPPRAWILPALWEITARFSADQPMTCQFLVRVRDDHQRLWEDGAVELTPNPMMFTPVLP